MSARVRVPTPAECQDALDIALFDALQDEGVCTRILANEDVSPAVRCEYGRKLEEARTRANTLRWLAYQISASADRVRAPGKQGKG